MFQQNGNGSLMNMGTWYTYNRKNSMHIKGINIVAVVGHDTDHIEWYQNNISGTMNSTNVQDKKNKWQKNFINGR